MTLAHPIRPEETPVVLEKPDLLEVRGLRIEAHGPQGPRTIVSDLDLAVRRGETLAIVGESGSGKSMTARAITGLLPAGVHASGSIRFEGRSLLGLKERERATFRGRHIGLVFQDPFTMLNPIIPIGEQLLEPVRDARGRRLRGAAARQEAARRLAEVGIRDASVADRYPFQLSGGMRQRVGLAASLAADPELLIADEPATALDVTTQNEVLTLLQSVREQRGMALILITHDLRIAFSACERVAVLYAGRLLETGPTVAVEDQPKHPYTLGLLMSEPDSDRRLAHLESIPGAVPRPDDVADECAFAPRCSFARAECRAGRPPLEPVGPEHRSACVRVHEIAPAMARQRQESLLAAGVPPDVGTYPSLLEVDRLHKRFSTGRGRENIAVHEASLTVGRGEAVGLVGESGSGKTTLSRCVVGLETPTSGTIRWAGDPDAATSRRRSVRRHAQMVFQDPYSSLNPRLTIESVLSEALRLAPSPPEDLSSGVDDLLSQVGLSSDYRKRRPARLSGGQRQRVAIARALALQPDVLICDEPVSALDVSVQAQILQLLRDVRERLGLGYLVITHDLAVVRQVVDRVYVMQAGRIVEEGPVDQVLDSPQHPYTQRLVDSIPRSTASPRKESTS